MQNCGAQNMRVAGGGRKGQLSRDRDFLTRRKGPFRSDRSGYRIYRIYRETHKVRL